MLTRPLARERWLLALLVSSYAFGAVVLALGLIPGFVHLTSAHLVFSSALLLAAHRPPSPRLWVWTAACYLIGWTVEYIGVHGGWLFGAYHYGEALGPRLWGIPLVIGVNWVLVVYAVCSSLNALMPNRSRLFKVVVASLALVLLDVLIEPVAIALEFWTWADGMPPLRNYLGWLGVAVVQSTVFFAVLPYSENRLAPWLLALQLAFFGSLRLVL